MAEQEYPVVVAVERNGRMEDVRVGTAVRSDEGFVLRLGDLRLGAPVAPGAGAGAGYPRSTPPPAADPGGGGMLLPNYGRSKGQPVYGATMGDLEYYANGCRRSLADSAKARWHDKEKVLLAAIEGEIIRQKGMPNMAPEGGGAGHGGGASYGGPPPGFDERPPPDDDVPF